VHLEIRRRVDSLHRLGTRDGLTDQHAVEGILVQVGQLGAKEGRGLVEGKRLDPMTFALVQNQVDRLTPSAAGERHHS
jgi:hypothetical protein